MPIVSVDAMRQAEKTLLAWPDFFLLRSRVIEQDLFWPTALWSRLLCIKVKEEKKTNQ
jgi:hypothetical protein